jgi:hypothetical protein
LRINIRGGGGNVEERVGTLEREPVLQREREGGGKISEERGVGEGGGK